MDEIKSFPKVFSESHSKPVSVGEVQTQWSNYLTGIHKTHLSTFLDQLQAELPKVQADW